MNRKKITAVVLSSALCISALTGCGINKNATVATMGDTKISLGLANFMCRYNQATLDDLYRSYFGDDVWEQDLYGDGSNMQEEVKDQVMDNLHEMETMAVADHMAEYGVELTDEEEAAIQEAAESFINGNSKKTLREMGATEEIVEEMLRLYTIKTKMKDAIMATADTEVSDEEANMRGYSVLYMSTGTYYDSTSGSYVEYTDDEVQAITLEMTLMATQIQSGDSMEDVADAYGATIDTDTYDADDTELDTEVKDTLDSLEEGETSGLITTDDGLYIVRLDTACDEEATEENRENIISQRQSDLYDEVLSGWQEEDGWTILEKQLAKISFKNVLTQTTETEETETEEPEATESADSTEE